MGTRWALPALAIAVGLAAAGCGSRSGTAAPAGPATVSTTSALTPYQRAYPVICQGATTAPPTDAPGVSAQPLWYRLAWRQGFCTGEVAVRAWAGQPAAGRTAVYDGNAARLALTDSPPRCGTVAGTPAEPFCP